MKFVGPQWQAQASGGGTSETQLDDLNKIIYSNTRPDDLENGLWIKNTKKLPLMEVSSWNRLHFYDQSKIDVQQVSSSLPISRRYLKKYSDSIYYSITSHLIIKYILDSNMNATSSTCLSGNLVNGYQNSSGYNYYSPGSCIVGNIIYVFGGSDYNCTSGIYKYDISTDTSTTLSASLSTYGACYDCEKFTYNGRTYIAIFNGYNWYRNGSTTACNAAPIRILDTYSNTITDTSLRTQNQMYLIDGTQLTLFGGTVRLSSSSSGSATNFTPCIFNLTTQTSTTLTFPNGTYSDLSTTYSWYNGGSISGHPNILNDRKFYIYNNAIIYIGSQYPSYFKQNIDLFDYNNYIYLGQSPKNQYFLNDVFGECITINNKLYAYKTVNNVTYLYTYTPGIMDSDYIPEGEVKFYPILINKTSDKLNLDIGIELQNKIDRICNLSTTLRNINNNNYSMIDSLYKIYRPDFSGEEQEAWKVRDGVWTSIDQVSFNDSVGTNNIVLASVTPGLGDNLLFGSNTNALSNTGYLVAPSYIANNISYYNTDGGYIFIRANIIQGFDDSVSFNGTYAYELYKKIKLIIYNADAGLKSSISAVTQSSYKYICITLSAYKTGYSGFGLYLEV